METAQTQEASYAEEIRAINRETAQILKEIAKLQEEAERQRIEAKKEWEEEAREQKEALAQEKEALRERLEADKKSWEEALRQRQEEDKKRWDEAEKQRIKEMAEAKRERDEANKEFNKKMSKLGDRFGEMIEHMVRPNLLRRFVELGFDFDKMSPQPWHVPIDDRILTEVDAFLENSEKAMIVEIKSKPSIDDIKEHLERMDKIRLWADRRNDKRRFFGAIGGMVMNENVRNFALKSGFYVIEPSDETFVVLAPEGEYSPKEW